ncbi:type II and III secretion system protein [Polynucleobacter acidiphobus]|uniref:type II and III secretion system protein n=1 Tax=Polynucleobacter acidiphobus TaxID=556053 RepID=UPI000D3B3605|nr:type II and III secretion system protein [Polynucleobacter acidiphobus]
MKHMVFRCCWIWLLLGPQNTFAYHAASGNAALNTPISISAKEMPLVDLLHALGQLGNTHFVLSPSIQGSINVQLADVPWQTALSTILASRGLRFMRNQGVYWIAPHQEINGFQKQRRDDSALPFGGEHHGTPRQILIEARIVEADHRFARNLGAKLGLRSQADNAPGGNGRAQGSFALGSPLGAGGLSGFEPVTAAATLLSKNATRLLDVELSALESDGQGKILSNPRIMTADMVKATIEQGTELPYQTSSSNGGNKIQFRKANLRLEVIPKIHHDGKVSLLVAINKDSVGMKTEQGYAIDTKNLSSEVSVENGGTVILGGIYQTTERDDTVKIPLLGDIPLIGHLFKHQSTLRDKTELLVFLTPTILDKPE